MFRFAVPGLLAAAFAAAPALAADLPPLAGTRLDVVATGEVRRTPDLAVVSAGVVTQASGAAKALADNAQRMAATVAAIRRAGVADRDIQTSAIRLEPQYRYADNQPPVITAYQATNQLTVRLRDVKGAGAVLDALVAAGANQIGGPDLVVDKPQAALDEARTAALATARARADLYAKAAGLTVRRIVLIGEAAAETPYRPMPMAAPMAAMRKSADTSVEPGEQTLSVTLNVTFELG